MQKLKVNEIFESIQGEGVFIGQPQVFVRLTECNMRCKWCDTKYAFEEGKEMSISDVVKKVQSYQSDVVCITGGEPMIQKNMLSSLVTRLKGAGFKVHLQTNGSIYDRDIFNSVDFISMDAKPPSSGEKSKIDVIKQASARKHQIKVVIKDDTDLSFSKEIINKFPESNIILQPEGGSNFRFLRSVDFSNSNIRILPQLHKIMGVK